MPKSTAVRANDDTRTAILERVLADHYITAESGLVWNTFDAARRDADDFANLSRNDVRLLMVAAFEAGLRA